MEEFNDIDISQLIQDFDFSLLSESALDLSPGSNAQVTNLTSSGHEHTSNIEVSSVSNAMNSTSSSVILESDVTHCADGETSSSPTLTENPSKLYICGRCGEKFSSCSLFEKHKKNHTEDYSCKECLKTFVSKVNLKRHQKLHHKETMPLFKCDQCGFEYSHKDDLKKHLKTYEKCPYVCTHCDKKFCRKHNLIMHIREQHTMHIRDRHTKYSRSDKSENFKRENVLHMFSSIRFEFCEKDNLNISSFLYRLKEDIENELLMQLNKKGMIKYFLTIQGHVSHSLKPENAEILPLCIDSNVTYIFSKSAISDCIDKGFNELMQQFQLLETEWTLKKIIRLSVCIIKHNVS